jgi:hypothetical protein
VVSYLHTPSELVFAADSGLVFGPRPFSAEGWTFRPLPAETSVYRLTSDGAGAPAITFAVLAQRNMAYYALTLGMPMTLVVLLAWVVHWIPPSVIPPRIGMASATVFSLIALGVSFRLTLPPIDYLTRADYFVIFSTLLVAISLCVAVATTRLVHHERDAAALRLARITRMLFPLAYLLAIALVVRP